MSLNSPLGGFQVLEDSRISRQSAYECDNIFSPTHRPPLAPEGTSMVLISVRVFVELSALVLPEGLSK